MARRGVRRTLSELGEDALIDRIARRAGGTAPGDFRLAIGDDAALLRPRAGQDLVLTTDAQIEHMHFRFGRETPRTVGRRALLVNLSDLAAMGATPVGALLSLAAPPSLLLRDFDALVAGFAFEAERFACPLVGGNLSRDARVGLHVTAVGRVARGRGLRRAGLRVGDELFVTGTLGGAALARMRADRTGRALARLPTPRIEAGRRLARRAGVRGCLDLSDGLGHDLPRLLRGSGLGATIDASALPRPRGFDRGCRELDLDPHELIAGGGEDYELLFARAPDGRAGLDPAPRLARGLGVPVTRIGAVTARRGVRGLPPVGAGHHF